MRPAFALLDLAVVAVALVGVTALRSRAWAWLLVVASAAWLPANNHVLEGPTLLGLSGDHGLTASDLLGVVGVLAGGLRLWPPATWRPGWWLTARAGVLAAVLLAGFLTALVATDVRVDDRRDRHDRAPGMRVQRD